MGGLSKKIRWTYGTMLVATFAITGHPSLQVSSPRMASSRRISEPTGSGVSLCFRLADGAATSFYMFRLIFLPSMAAAL